MPWRRFIVFLGLALVLVAGLHSLLSDGDIGPGSTRRGLRGSVPLALAMPIALLASTSLSGWVIGWGLSGYSRAYRQKTLLPVVCYWGVLVLCYAAAWVAMYGFSAPAKVRAVFLLFGALLTLLCPYVGLRCALTGLRIGLHGEHAVVWRFTRKTIVRTLTVASAVTLLAWPISFWRAADASLERHDFMYGQGVLVVAGWYQPPQMRPSLTKFRHSWPPGFRLDFRDRPSTSGWLVEIDLWFVAMVLAYIPVYAWIQRQYRRKRGLCGHCGYDLTGNVRGACPECGERK